MGEISLVPEQAKEIADALYQLAWADGEVNQREVDVISALLERLGLPLVERLASMDRALSQPPGLSAGGVELECAAQRERAMQSLVTLCFADGNLHPEELRLIGDLALAWGIRAEQLDAMRRTAGDAL